MREAKEYLPVKQVPPSEILDYSGNSFDLLILLQSRVLCYQELLFSRMR